MEALAIIFFLLFFTHFIFLFMYNHYRLFRLLRFFKKLRHQHLSEKDYEFLRKRYTNMFFSTFEGFPDKGDFPDVYADPKFASFVAGSKKIFKYLFISIPTYFVLFNLLGLGDNT